MEIKRFDRTRNQRQRRRTERLNDAARRLGFSTWRVFETAVINSNKVTVVIDGAVSGDEQ